MQHKTGSLCDTAPLAGANRADIHSITGNDQDRVKPSGATFQAMRSPQVGTNKGHPKFVGDGIRSGPELRPEGWHADLKGDV